MVEQKKKKNHALRDERNKKSLFSCHNTDKYGHLGDFNLSAQQISSIIFQCSALYHSEFDFLWLFIHLRPERCLQMPCNFIL